LRASTSGLASLSSGFEARRDNAWTNQSTTCDDAAP
jgi:hypothetical protein